MEDINANGKVQPANIAMEVLVQPVLLWHLCENSWMACAVVSRLLCARLHSRWGLRPLVVALPPTSPSPVEVVQAVGEQAEAVIEGASARFGSARRRLWRRLCLGAFSFAPTEEETYQGFACRACSADAEIERDVGRSFPGSLNEKGTQAMFRVLRSVAHRLEDIGYCQGMNFIAGVFLRVFLEDASGKACEALVYQCVLSILLRHGMNQFYGNGFPKLRLTMVLFDCLVESFFPDLGDHFNRFNLSAEFYATKWFLTLFSGSLPFPHVLRVWDNFLCRGIKFVHRVGLALLSEARSELLSSGFDGTLARLRDLGHTSLSPEALVEVALEFKVTNRLLSELEHVIAGGSFAAGQQPKVVGDNDGRVLPFCFPERDLNNGRTRWRIAEMAPGSAPLAGWVTGGAAESMSPGNDRGDFIEDLLPAARVPSDPWAPALWTNSLPQEQSLGSVNVQGSASSSRRAGTRALKHLPSAMFRRVRRPHAPKLLAASSPAAVAHDTDSALPQRLSPNVNSPGVSSPEDAHSVAASSAKTSPVRARLVRPGVELAWVEVDCLGTTRAVANSDAWCTPVSPGNAIVPALSGAGKESRENGKPIPGALSDDERGTSLESDSPRSIDVGTSLYQLLPDVAAEGPAEANGKSGKASRSRTKRIGKAVSGAFKPLRRGTRDKGANKNAETTRSSTGGQPVEIIPNGRFL